MKRVSSFLNNDEKILHEIKPFFPKLLIKSNAFLLSLLMFVLFIIVSVAFKFSTILLIITLLTTLFGLIVPTFTYLFTTYYITNQKVIIESGWIGKDYDIIKLERVVDVSLDVTVIDSILNTGSIKLCTANDNEPMFISDIPKPKNIVRAIQF